MKSVARCGQDVAGRMLPRSEAWRREDADGQIMRTNSSTEMRDVAIEPMDIDNCTLVNNGSRRTVRGRVQRSLKNLAHRYARPRFLAPVALATMTVIVLVSVLSGSHVHKDMAKTRQGSSGVAVDMNVRGYSGPESDPMLEPEAFSKLDVLLEDSQSTDWSLTDPVIMPIVKDRRGTLLEVVEPAFIARTVQRREAQISMKTDDDPLVALVSLHDTDKVSHKYVGP